MFERYTEKARRVIFFARYEASHYGASEISIEHLLLGLLREAKSLFRSAPSSSTAWESTESIRQEIDKAIEHRPSIATSVDLPLSRECKVVLTAANDEAEKLSHRHIGTEHLLLGILRQEKSLAAQILQRRAFDPVKIREGIAKSPSVENPRSFRQSHPKVLEISRETIIIHDTQHDAETIRIRVVECLAFSWYWRKQQWTPRDLVVERNTGHISFDLSLAENNEVFEVASHSWKYDLCAICRWRLHQSPGQEHSTGYTNGRDWVCLECYDKFLKRSDYFGSSYGEIT